MTTDPETLTRRSLDGRIEVRFAQYEVRMSLWVLEPIVVRMRDGREVVSLDGTGWDGGGVMPTFPARDRVELHLRRYPEGGRLVDVVLDVEAETFWAPDAPEPARPARELAAALERGFARHVEATAHDYLAQGLCPRCKAQLHPPGRLGRLAFGDEVECLVCERRWTLPR